MPTCRVLLVSQKLPSARLLQPQLLATKLELLVMAMLVGPGQQAEAVQLAVAKLVGPELLAKAGLLGLDPPSFHPLSLVLELVWPFEP